MRQSEGGADLPRSRSADVITRYVSGGNVWNERQFDAALYVRPVNAATAAMPPNSSMTVDVVPITSMTGGYNPKNLGNQAPKFDGLNINPSFFYNGGVPRPITMTPAPGTPADRARRIRIAMGFQTQKAFAKHYGFTPNQWNNIERGSPISRIVAQSLARQIPGLSVGWVLDAETGGLSLEMARRLGILPPGAS